MFIVIGWITWCSRIHMQDCWNVSIHYRLYPGPFDLVCIVPIYSGTTCWSHSLAHAILAETIQANSPISSFYKTTPTTSSNCTCVWTYLLLSVSLFPLTCHCPALFHDISFNQITCYLNLTRYSLLSHSVYHHHFPIISFPITSSSIQIYLIIIHKHVNVDLLIDISRWW